MKLHTKNEEVTQGLKWQAKNVFVIRENDCIDIFTLEKVRKLQCTFGYFWRSF